MTTPLSHADIDDAIPASGLQLASRVKTNALLKRMAFHAPEAAAAVERSVQERLGDVVSIKDFGARGEFTRATDISTTALSTTVTAAADRWTAADVGKWIFIEGAGNYNGYTTFFRSIITTFVSPTQITVADAAVNDTSGVYADWGSNDTTPLRNAIAWCRDNGRDLLLPSGVYTVDPAVMNTAIAVNNGGRLVIRGAGPSTVLRRMGASMITPATTLKMLRLDSTSGGCRLIQISDMEIDANIVQNPTPDGQPEAYQQAASIFIAGNTTSKIDLVITRDLTLRNGLGDHIRVGINEEDLQVKVNLFMAENIVERDRVNGRAAIILQSSIDRVIINNVDADINRNPEDWDVGAGGRAMQYEFNQVPTERNVFHFYSNIFTSRWKMSEGQRCVVLRASQIRVTGLMSSITTKDGRADNCDIVFHGTPSAGVGMVGKFEFVDSTFRIRADIIWKGPWVDGVYLAREAVSYNGAAYVAVVDVSAGQEPGAHTNWEVIGASNTRADGIRIKWVSGEDGELTFTRCRFVIDVPDIVGNMAGYAIAEATAVLDTDATIRRITFEDCEFGG